LHTNIHKTVEETLLCIICDISINELAASSGMVKAKCDCFAFLITCCSKGCWRMSSLLNLAFCDLHGNSLKDCCIANHYSVCKQCVVIINYYKIAATVTVVPFAIPLYTHAMHSSWTYQCPPLCPIHFCSPQKVSILL